MDSSIYGHLEQDGVPTEDTLSANYSSDDFVFQEPPSSSVATEAVERREQPRVSSSAGSNNNEPREQQVFKMYRFILYETSSRFYLVGVDVTDSRHRILKIDRTAESGELSIADDDTIYSKGQLTEVLRTIDDGNKTSGGLKLNMHAWGLLGFIRFTGDYYMLLVTKRSSVGIVGGHYIYRIDGTELIPLTSSVSNRVKADRHPEEARFVSILHNLDLTRSFYFSYSYDITNTLQRNISWERENIQRNSTEIPRKSYNKMFVWNHFLLQPTSKVLKNIYDWCIPIIHGFVNQSRECVPIHCYACPNMPE